MEKQYKQVEEEVSSTPFALLCSLCSPLHLESQATLRTIVRFPAKSYLPYIDNVTAIRAKRKGRKSGRSNVLRAQGCTNYALRFEACEEKMKCTTVGPREMGLNPFVTCSARAKPRYLCTFQS